MLRKSDIPDEVNVWHEEEIDDLREKNSTNRDFSRYIKYLESNYFDEYKDEARYRHWFGLISASIWYFIFASSLIFIYHCISVVYIPFSHVTIIPTYHEIQGVEQPLEDPSTTYFFSSGHLDHFYNSSQEIILTFLLIFLGTFIKTLEINFRNNKDFRDGMVHGLISSIKYKPRSFIELCCHYSPSIFAHFNALFLTFSIFTLLNYFISDWYFPPSTSRSVWIPVDDSFSNMSRNELTEFFTSMFKRVLIIPDINYYIFWSIRVLLVPLSYLSTVVVNFIFNKIFIINRLDKYLVPAFRRMYRSLLLKSNIKV